MKTGSVVWWNQRHNDHIYICGKNWGLATLGCMGVKVSHDCKMLAMKFKAQSKVGLSPGSPSTCHQADRKTTKLMFWSGFHKAESLTEQKSCVQARWSINLSHSHQSYVGVCRRVPKRFDPNHVFKSVFKKMKTCHFILLLKVIQTEACCY